MHLIYRTRTDLRGFKSVYIIMRARPGLQAECMCSMKTIVVMLKVLDQAGIMSSICRDLKVQTEGHEMLLAPRLRLEHTLQSSSAPQA